MPYCRPVWFLVDVSLVLLYLQTRLPLAPAARRCTARRLCDHRHPHTPAPKSDGPSSRIGVQEVRARLRSDMGVSELTALAELMQQRLVWAERACASALVTATA